jgi:uncharacterized protein YceH (UPF0502 family)
MDGSKPLPYLSAEEQRVLGSLIEKSVVTPDYYPMTLNSLTAACNQRSSRKPVVDYSEDIVLNALHSLKAQSLVSTAVGASIRATKYKHNFTTVYPLTNAELAIICLLLLRGPQTPGELNTNSGRLHEFSSLSSVHEALDKLRSYPHPFVKEQGRQAGQKETRFVHLLGDAPVESETSVSVSEPLTKTNNDLDARVSALEAEVAELKEKLRDLLG